MYHSFTLSSAYRLVSISQFGNMLCVCVRNSKHWFMTRSVCVCVRARARPASLEACTSGRVGLLGTGTSGKRGEIEAEWNLETLRRQPGRPATEMPWTAARTTKFNVKALSVRHRAVPTAMQNRVAKDNQSVAPPLGNWLKRKKSNSQAQLHLGLISSGLTCGSSTTSLFSLDLAAWTRKSV